MVEAGPKLVILTDGENGTYAATKSENVFRPAITDSASAVVLVHNHPSGDATPSAEDVRITRQLVEAGKLIDIKVLDHIIIGRPDNGNKPQLSMREEGICQF